jgi:hypothetical protein
MSDKSDKKVVVILPTVDIEIPVPLDEASRSRIRRKNSVHDVELVRIGGFVNVGICEVASLMVLDKECTTIR